MQTDFPLSLDICWNSLPSLFPNIKIACEHRPGQKLAAKCKRRGNKYN